MTISVLGAGAFGTALAMSLVRAGHRVTLWARDPETVAAINGLRIAPRLPGVTLPKGLLASADLSAVAQSDVVLLAVPMQGMGGVLRAIPDAMAGQRLVACCKGIDLTDLHGATAVIQKAKPRSVPALLTGPSFAADIARNLPTALTLACTDQAQGAALQGLLSSPTLRLYRTTDVIGAELGGALKNVIAIACGAAIGAGLGESARAALMTRGFAEMMRLATALGARPETLSGLSGFGDLALTCMSEQSRNTRFGIALGQGAAFDPNATVEGIKTADAAAALAQTLGIDMPICQTVTTVSGRASSVGQAIQTLLNRPLKEE